MSPPSITPSRSAVHPDRRWVFGAWYRILAFGFGSGLVRPAPGTWGTLLGWLIWVFVLGHASVAVQACAIGIGFALGCVACQRTGNDLNAPDHGGMVWDEIIAIWLVLWLTPATWPMQAVAFVLFRFFDILKPPPVRWADRRFKNGFGVMFDDLVAALYSLLAMALVVHFFGIR